MVRSAIVRQDEIPQQRSQAKADTGAGLRTDLPRGAGAATASAGHRSPGGRDPGCCDQSLWGRIQTLTEKGKDDPLQKPNRTLWLASPTVVFDGDERQK